MAVTPYPQNLFHLGSARALTLDVQLDVPPSGDILIYTKGNATSSGWQPVPNGQKMVVTVGRGTQYEAKYLVSSITFAASVTTMRVLAADRGYDGVPPTVAPAGTTVEHTVSATEMATINDHMRTRLAHGSDGELVDQNSVQTLTNKTLTAAKFSGNLDLNSAKITELASGTVSTDAVNKSQLDAVSTVADAALPKAGGTVTGKITLDGNPSSALHAAPKQYVDLMLPKTGGTMSGAIAMGSQKVTGLASGTASGDAVNKSQLDAVSTVANAANSTATTANNTANAALPKAGGTITGSLTVNGDFATNKVTAGVGGMECNGDMKILTALYVTDYGLPLDMGGANSDRRWVTYTGTGRVHRMSDTVWRFTVAGITSSSRRYKEQIGSNPATPDVTRLQPRSFRWKADGVNDVIYRGERLGFIAEEVAAVDQRLVTHDADGEIQGLDTNALIAVLVETVTDLQERIAALEAAK